MGFPRSAHSRLTSLPKIYDFAQSTNTNSRFLVLKHIFTYADFQNLSIQSLSVSILCFRYPKNEYIKNRC